MWKEIATERRRLADDLGQVSTVQWTEPTVCDEWNVKQVLAHLVLPFEVSRPAFGFRVLRNRRDVQKTIMQLTERVDRTFSASEMIASLRNNAESKWKPPGTTAAMPLTEIVVHGQDIRNAMGLAATIPQSTIDLVLDAAETELLRADYAARIAVR